MFYLRNSDVQGEDKAAIGIWTSIPVAVHKVLIPYQAGMVSGHVELFPLCEIHKESLNGAEHNSSAVHRALGGAHTS